MIQAVQYSTTDVDSLQFAPAGLSHPLPAHRAHSRSIRANPPEVRL
jgi:hypothetical protein